MPRAPRRSGTRRAGARRRRSNQEGAEELEARWTGTGLHSGVESFPKNLRAGGLEALQAGRHQDRDRRLNLPRRFWLSGGRGHEAVVVVRHALFMLVAMRQGLGQAGDMIRGAFVSVLKEVRSKPEPLRHRGRDDQEESYGEEPAEQHGWIVPYSACVVNCVRKPPTQQGSALEPRA